MQTGTAAPSGSAAGPPALPIWLRAAVGVVAAAYLAVGAHGAVVVLGDLLGWAGDNALRFPGDLPSTGRQELQRDLLAVTLRGVGVATVGVVLGLWSRRRTVVGLFGAAAAVALVVGLTSYAVAWPDAPDRPAWEDRGPRGCVELSGEPSDCP